MTTYTFNTTTFPNPNFASELVPQFVSEHCICLHSQKSVLWSNYKEEINMTTYTFPTTFTNPNFASEQVPQFASEHCISYKQKFHNIFEFYFDNFDCIEEAPEQFDNISTPILERKE